MNCIYAINGPVVKVRDTKSFSMREMVMVGKSKLIGEVIGVTDEQRFRFTRVRQDLCRATP